MHEPIEYEKLIMSTEETLEDKDIPAVVVHNWAKLGENQRLAEDYTVRIAPFAVNKV